MIITSYGNHNIKTQPTKRRNDYHDVSFGAGPDKFIVKNRNYFKNVLPIIAFAGSALGSIGYLVGGTGLFYDLHKSRQKQKSAFLLNQNKPQNTNLLTMKGNSSDKKAEDGVKTISAETKFGKIGIKFAKMALTATAISGVSTGLGEGIPLMALGEATNLGASSILETPVGTGLFGIGIASIFSSLALDNTPHLKLNHFEVMAKKGFLNKAEIILKNMVTVAWEITKSVGEIAKNIYKPKFWKEDLLRITPKNIVMQEITDKDGKITFARELRHKKNYLMHAASFTLAIGGISLVLTSLFNQKKAQKASLKTEEGGFLFDNLGMTKMGLDKFTTTGKAAGASFAVGGVVNAVSQFMGIDNSDGRALQWLGIAAVFLGFSIDRGKNLSKSLKETMERPALTQIVREWTFDLSKVIKDKNILKKALREVKLNSVGKADITSAEYINFENTVKKALGFNEESSLKELNLKHDAEIYKDIKTNLESIGVDAESSLIKPAPIENPETKKLETAYSTSIMEYGKARNILKICSDRILGPIPELAPKK